MRMPGNAQDLCDSTGTGAFTDTCVVGAMCRGMASTFISYRAASKPEHGTALVENVQTDGAAEVFASF